MGLMTIHKSRKQELRTDGFLKASSRLISFLRERTQLVALGAAGVVLAAVVVSGGLYYLSSAERSAASKLAAAADEKDAAKQKSLLAEVSSATMTKASAQASLMIAQRQVEEGDTAGALASLAKAQKAEAPLVRDAAAALRAAVLVQTGKLDEALGVINAALPKAVKPFSDELSYRKARIAELKGNAAEAKTLYAEIEKNSPDFFLTKVVESRRGSL